MIQETHGDILKAPVEALVNTVNTVGVMGKGIALQFARTFPQNLAAYEAACRRKEVVPGRMFITENPALVEHRYIINFPTKRHWRHPSRLEDIASGLRALVEEVQRLNIRSIAVPPLGCGNGGLDWAEVRPLIEQAFAAVPEVRVYLHGPAGAPPAEQMKTRTKRPRMTATTAATLGILGRYARFDYRLSLLEIHKLVYFLKVAGEPMARTVFEKGPYGPYADSLRHVLNRLEGHFLRGWGDGTKNQPETPIHVLPDAIEEAEAYLQDQGETLVRFERVNTLIEGFETPFGLELLATVHWVAEAEGAPDEHAALSSIRGWSSRKSALFREPLVSLAWRRLGEQGWLPQGA